MSALLTKRQWKAGKGFLLRLRANPPLWIFGVILHEQSRCLIDPGQGVIYGRSGAQVGSTRGNGYVRLRRDCSAGHQYAHRLIWEAVYGPIPRGFHIDHLNGQKADNRICNLDAVTPSENFNRAIATGLTPIGEQKTGSKLTEADVVEIRRTAGEIGPSEWARRLGVDPATIRAARDGRTWKNVGRGCARKPAARRSRRPRARRVPKEVG
ncbi:HNH endonuclease signature motif containing protein [Lysobacter sp. GCM10012299]|uniref:HNH endonuclease signature motif containing protein n=1 Tax=Lysobacter sp. GCM10012299 TaxID=3317333 RepID=UPI00361B5D5B